MSRERLVSVLETVTEAIITIDRFGIIDTFNPAAERMFGYSQAEAIGQNVSMLMPEPHRSEHDGYIERYLRTGETRIIGVGRELVGQRRDGSTFPIEIAVTEIGHLHCFTGIIRDITERKRAKEALEHSRTELQALSARLLAAEDAERRRISRELHDDVNQRLAMISIDLESLAGNDALDEKTSTTLASLGEQVAELSEDIHGMAYRLHPSIVDDLGLSAAIRALASEFSKRNEIDVRVHERQLPRGIPATVASCLYRVAQESLTNIVKHSESNRATIRLFGRDRAIRLSLTDYGIGFDPKETRNQGASLGLLSMEERVRLIGGTLSIRSSPGRGTTIRVSVSDAIASD